jgi:hypothetical protein
MTRREPCPVCRRPVLLRSDGQLRTHLDKARLGGYCAGSRAQVAPRPPRPRPRTTGKARYVTGSPEARAWADVGNRERTLSASVRDVVIARKLLEAGGLSERHEAIIGARYAHPDWCWREIGDAAGLDKDVAFGVFRRLAVKAGLR